MRPFLLVLSVFATLSLFLTTESCGESHKDNETKESPYHKAMKENKRLANLLHNGTYDKTKWEPAKIEETLKQMSNNVDDIASLQPPDTVTDANKAQYDGYLKAFKKKIEDLRGHLKSSSTAEAFRENTKMIQLKASCASCHKTFQKKDDH